MQARALNKSAAADAIAKLRLDARNRALAEHWLSLWAHDGLPARSCFNPSKLKTHLPNLLMFDVVPDERVTVRLAGTGYRSVLGMELTGRDWIAMAPEKHRRLRLRNMSTVARGAVLVARRRMAMVAGGDHENEELVLPFAPDDSGVHPVVAHADWKLDHLSKVTSIAWIDDASRDFELVPLK